MPPGLPLATAGGEVQDHGPGALVVARGVPLGDTGVDSAPGEPLAHASSERGGRALAAPAATEPDGAGEPGNVLAFCQDRALVAVHLLDGPPRALGDLLGRGPGTDEGLYFSGSHGVRHLDLKLPQPGAVTARGRAEGLVEWNAEAGALGVGEQKVLPVLMNTDQTQVVHWPLPYRHTGD